MKNKKSFEERMNSFVAWTFVLGLVGYVGVMFLLVGLSDL